MATPHFRCQKNVPRSVRLRQVGGRLTKWLPTVFFKIRRGVAKTPAPNEPTRGPPVHKQLTLVEAYNDVLGILRDLNGIVQVKRLLLQEPVLSKLF